VDDVAGGEDPRRAGLVPLIDDGTARDRVEADTGFLRELVLGDQTHREQERITGDDLLCARNGLPFLVHGHCLYGLDAFPADDALDGVAQLQGDVEVHQTLDVVAAEARQVGHHLEHTLDLGALEGQASRHDHTDVARAQDHNLFPGHIAFDVHPSLCGACRVDASRARARDADLGPRALATAHREHQRPGAQLVVAVARTGDKDAARAVAARVRFDIEDHRVKQCVNAEAHGLVDEALGVARAGEILSEDLQTEAIVDALEKDAAQLAVAFQKEHIVGAGLLCSARSSQAARPAADDDHVVVAFHGWPTQRSLSCEPGTQSYCPSC